MDVGLWLRPRDTHERPKVRGGIQDPKTSWIQTKKETHTVLWLSFTYNLATINHRIILCSFWRSIQCLDKNLTSIFQVFTSNGCPVRLIHHYHSREEWMLSHSEGFWGILSFRNWCMPSPWWPDWACIQYQSWKWHSNHCKLILMMPKGPYCGSLSCCNLSGSLLARCLSLFLQAIRWLDACIPQIVCSLISIPLVISSIMILGSRFWGAI